MLLTHAMDSRDDCVPERRSVSVSVPGQCGGVGGWWWTGTGGTGLCYPKHLLDNGKRCFRVPLILCEYCRG